jgi:GNAT superfamily N-acetyltransferase
MSNVLDDFIANFCPTFEKESKLSQDEKNLFRRYTGDNLSPGFDSIVNSTGSRHLWDYSVCDIIFLKQYFKIFRRDDVNDIFPLPDPIGFLRGNISVFAIQIVGDIDNNIVINPNFMHIDRKSYSHLIVLAIQIVNNSIKFSLYDPHGIGTSYDTSNINNFIKQQIQTRIGKYYYNFPQIPVIDVSNSSCPFMGVQIGGETAYNKGFCVLWSNLILRKMIQYNQFDNLYIQNGIINEASSKQKSLSIFLVEELRPVIQEYLDIMVRAYKMHEEIIKYLNTYSQSARNAADVQYNEKLIKIKEFIEKKYHSAYNAVELKRFDTVDKVNEFIKNSTEESFDICLENSLVNRYNFPSPIEEDFLIGKSDVTYRKLHKKNIREFLTDVKQTAFIEDIKAQYKRAFPEVEQQYIDAGVEFTLNFSGAETYISYIVTNNPLPEYKEQVERALDSGDEYGDDYYEHEFISMASIMKQGETLVGIYNVFTNEKYRGTGLSASFMRTIILPEAIKQSNNLKYNVYLEVVKNNNQAISLYETLGFVKLYNTPLSEPRDYMYYDPSIEVRTELYNIYGPKPMDLSSPFSDVVDIYNTKRGIVVKFKNRKKRIVVHSKSNKKAKGLYTQGFWNNVIHSSNRRKMIKRIESNHRIKINVRLARKSRAKKIA